MRERLMQILSSDDVEDRTTDAALRGFWGRAKPLRACELPKRTSRAGTARVVDLAQWKHSRESFRGRGPKHKPDASS
jgi:hypothetical protein